MDIILQDDLSIKILKITLLNPSEMFMFSVVDKF